MSLLPPHWGRLYELTKLTDEQSKARLSTGCNPSTRDRGAAPEYGRPSRTDHAPRLGREAETWRFPSRPAAPLRRSPTRRGARECGRDMRAAASRRDQRAASHLGHDPGRIRRSTSQARRRVRRFGPFRGTFPALPQAFEVMAAWSFVYKTGLPWENRPAPARVTGSGIRASFCWSGRGATCRPRAGNNGLGRSKCRPLSIASSQTPSMTG